MDLILLRTYQRQVETHCRFALFAAQGIQQTLNTEEGGATWFWVEAFLNATANLSKAFWPNQDRAHPVDRKPLRDSLGVSEPSPLQIRKMRNHFEHFDERLEQWWVDDPNHNIVDHNIMPRSYIAGLPDISFFRMLDPSTGDVMFWSDSYNLPSIVKEIERLLPIAQAEAAKPHWDPPPTA